MASSIASAAIAGRLPLQARDCLSTRSSLYGNTLPLTVRGKSYQQRTKRSLSVCAKYNARSRKIGQRSNCITCENANRGGSAGDFVAGFLIGGAIFGALGYVFAPQIRRSLLNEDEYGFQRARRPIYYNEGLEKARQTLNAKISQLISAIDNVSTWLRGGKKAPPVPVEIEADESVK